jgi:hypothetical protein
VLLGQDLKLVQALVAPIWASVFAIRPWEVPFLAFEVLIFRLAALLVMPLLPMFVFLLGW